MSKRTRANFIAVQTLAREKIILQRQIDFLISHLSRIGENIVRIGEYRGFIYCPTQIKEPCEFADCETCWRENARRHAEEMERRDA